MYCDNAQFNPYDLSGFSEENELGISYNCVSNMLKVCVFSVYLIIFFVLSLYSLAGLLREYVRNPHWNASKRRFTCTFLVALAYMGLLPIFITGTFKRGKYILFPFTFWPIFIAAGASIAEWYKASKLMEKSGNSMKEETMAVLNKIYYAFQVIQGSGFFLWWAILPMIFFDNPWILNWVFICGYVHTGLVLIFVCLFGFKVANVLLNTIRPHLAETLVDKKIVSFVEGVRGNLHLVCSDQYKNRFLFHPVGNFFETDQSGSRRAFPHAFADYLGALDPDGNQSWTGLFLLF